MERLTVQRPPIGDDAGLLHQRRRWSCPNPGLALFRAHGGRPNSPCRRRISQYHLVAVSQNLGHVYELVVAAGSPMIFGIAVSLVQALIRVAVFTGEQPQ